MVFSHLLVFHLSIKYENIKCLTNAIPCLHKKYFYSPFFHRKHTKEHILVCDEYNATRYIDQTPEEISKQTSRLVSQRNKAVFFDFSQIPMTNLVFNRNNLFIKKRSNFKFNSKETRLKLFESWRNKACLYKGGKGGRNKLIRQSNNCQGLMHDITYYKNFLITGDVNFYRDEVHKLFSTNNSKICSKISFLHRRIEKGFNNALCLFLSSKGQTFLSLHPSKIQSVPRIWMKRHIIWLKSNKGEFFRIILTVPRSIKFLAQIFDPEILKYLVKKGAVLHNLLANKTMRTDYRDKKFDSGIDKDGCITILKLFSRKRAGYNLLLEGCLISISHLWRRLSQNRIFFLDKYEAQLIGLTPKFPSV